VDGSCRSPCTSSTQCPSGQLCKVGYCMPSDSPDSGKACAVNCDCPSGERCVEGFCRI
jgi:Cys-rich repeat protein